MEIPSFSTSVEDYKVIVTAEGSTLKPAVVFDMLALLALRDYNVVKPKEENMTLNELPERPQDRLVQTQLATEEAFLRMNGLINQYYDQAVGLQEISERSYQALIDRATYRTDSHD